MWRGKREQPCPCTHTYTWPPHPLGPEKEDLTKQGRNQILVVPRSWMPPPMPCPIHGYLRVKICTISMYVYVWSTVKIMMEYITNIIFIIPCMQTTNKYGVFLVESSFIAFTFFLLLLLGKPSTTTRYPSLFFCCF